MPSSLLSSFGEALSKKWVDRLFGPGMVFWGLGLLIGLGPQALTDRWKVFLAASLAEQTAPVILGLAVLMVMDRLVESLSPWVLRFLEGYWLPPFRWAAAWVISIRQKSIQKKRQRRSALSLKRKDGQDLTKKERLELGMLESELYYTPRDDEDITLSRLGDILRTAEKRPYQRYGLDAVLFWPRLWGLLSEEIREDLGASRGQLDRWAQIWFWGLLFLVWGVVNPWALLIGFIWMWAAYRMAAQAAMEFCDLVLAVFDTQRWLLYEALRWPLPSQSGQAERTAGEALTRCIQRGMGEKIFYQHPKE